MTKEISLEQPLLEQASVREILFPEKEGLISNLMLKRLLKITRVLIQNQLRQKFQNYELANLVVGYDVFTEDKNGQIPKQIPQRFSVEWKHKELNKSIVIDPDSLVIEFLGVLLTSLQETFKELITKSLEDKSFHACLLVSLAKETTHIDETSGRSRNLLSRTSTPKFTYTGGCNCFDDIRNIYVRRNSDNNCPPLGEGVRCNPFGR